jgi:uncharacterized protein (TIGR00730 family)
MKQLSVFCGSSSGNNPIFEQQAYLLGKTLAQNNIGLVYGGTRVGLMGCVANGVLDHGGNAIGVLPYFLKRKEIEHTRLNQLIMVDTLQERKTRMNELSDGAIALPGGYGTMEEFFEMLTWGQLQIHLKPVGILNINSYYDPLMEMADKMVKHCFLKQANRDMLLSDTTIEGLLEKMITYKAPVVGKWIQ